MSFRIAVISYGGGHINIVLPVVKRCLTAGLDVDLIALTGAKPLAERQGYKTLGYEDFVSGSEKEKIINFGKDLIDQNFNPESGITVEESLCYLGVNWAENLQRYGKKLTETLYDRVGRHSFLPITFFENIITDDRWVPIRNYPNRLPAGMHISSAEGLFHFLVLTTFTPYS